MAEDFGWAGDEYFLGDCQDDRLELAAMRWQDMQDAMAQAMAEEDADDEDADDLYSEYYDESMDGDAESALASVGWGMDEDYGVFSDECADW